MTSVNDTIERVARAIYDHADSYKARQLDPDIASLRSISLQGKYQMQIKREYQRGIDAELSSAEGDLARELWAKEHGGRI